MPGTTLAEPTQAPTRPRGYRRHGPLRLLLLGILSAGLAGTGVELLLLEHTEWFWQLVPLVLIAIALVALAAFVFRASRATLRAFQLVMLLLVVSAAVGLWLHYDGNAAFELEMAPALVGFALFTKSMMGATPALAPGSLAQLGLLGLAVTFRHPIIHGAAGDV